MNQLIDNTSGKVFLPFSQKNFSLATLAQLHFIPRLEIQVSNVILPTPGYVFLYFCFFGVIIPNSQLTKCTKACIKSHKIAYKMSKKHLRLGLCPDPAGEAYFVFYRTPWEPREGEGLGGAERGEGHPKFVTEFYKSGHHRTNGIVNTSINIKLFILGHKRLRSTALYSNVSVFLSLSITHQCTLVN